MFTELYKEEKREEVDRGGQENKGWNQKRETDPVISSLSVLHHLEHTKRFTELCREEKGERADRGDLVEKMESPKGERAVKLVILLPSKSGY